MIDETRNGNTRTRSILDNPDRSFEPILLDESESDTFESYAQLRRVRHSLDTRVFRRVTSLEHDSSA